MLRYAMRLPGTIHQFEAERDKTDPICQDNYAIREAPGIIAGVLCDGAGSYSHAHIGSYCMAQRIAHELVSRAAFYLGNDARAQRCALINVIRQELTRLSASWSEPADAFSSTLLAVLMDKRNGHVAAFQLGDGIILGGCRGEALAPLVVPAAAENRYATWLTSCAPEDLRRELRVSHRRAERVFLSSDGAADMLFSADGTQISASVDEFIATMQNDPAAMQQLPHAISTQLRPYDDFSMVLLDASIPDALRLARTSHAQSLRAARKARAYVRASDAGLSHRHACYAAGISGRSFSKRYLTLLKERLLA